MGEDPTLFTPEFNHSVHVESRPQHLSGDCGAVLLRDVLERLGLTDWLVGRLHDRRRLAWISTPAEVLTRRTRPRASNRRDASGPVARALGINSTNELHL